MNKKDLLMARLMSDLTTDVENSNDKYYTMLNDGVLDKDNNIIIQHLKLSNILFKFEEIEVDSLFKHIKDYLINAESIRRDKLLLINSSFESLLHLFEWGSPMYLLLESISNKLDKFTDKNEKVIRLHKPTREDLSSDLVRLSRLLNTLDTTMPEIYIIKESLVCLKLYNQFADVTALITVENLPEKYKSLDQKLLNTIKNIVYRAQTDNNVHVMKFKTFDEILGEAND